MADVKVIRCLLLDNAALTAVVAPSSVVGGRRLPEGTPLPAITVAHVSGVRTPDVQHGASALRRARVQVTVHADSYPLQKQVFSLVVGALPATRGVVDGVSVDSVLPALEGPDAGDDDAGLFQQTYDVIVTYSL